MLPFIHCHHVCGLADSGGLRKPISNESANEEDTVRPRHNRAKLGDRRGNCIMSQAFFIFILREGLAGMQYQVLAELKFSLLFQAINGQNFLSVICNCINSKYFIQKPLNQADADLSD
jgi:hypothetical protein